MRKISGRFSAVVGITALMGLMMMTSGAQAQTPSYNLLYSFTGPDGADPVASLVVDTAGNLYGTTLEGGYMGGGQCDYTLGCGVVFELDSSGNETVLWKGTFTGPSFPAGGVVLDPLGNLYGATTVGGGPGGGVAYELTGGRSMNCTPLEPCRRTGQALTQV